jgi:hypothetical protein
LNTCTHPVIVKTRQSFRTSLSHLVPRLVSELHETRKRGRIVSPAPELSAEEVTALAAISLPMAAPLSPLQVLEIQLYSYRLLLASPWAARNAMPGHHVASALGKLFDSITAGHVAINPRRKVCATMCIWVLRWIKRFARDRQGAILALTPLTTVPPKVPEVGAGISA